MADRSRSSSSSTSRMSDWTGDTCQRREVQRSMPTHQVEACAAYMAKIDVDVSKIHGSLRMTRQVLRPKRSDLQTHHQVITRPTEEVYWWEADT